MENSQFAKAKYEPNPAASGALCKNNANEISNPTSLFWPDALTTDDKLRKKSYSQYRDAAIATPSIKECITRAIVAKIADSR